MTPATFNNLDAFARVGKMWVQAHEFNRIRRCRAALGEHNNTRYSSDQTAASILANLVRRGYLCRQQHVKTLPAFTDRQQSRKQAKYHQTHRIKYTVNVYAFTEQAVYEYLAYVNANYLSYNCL